VSVDSNGPVLALSSGSLYSYGLERVFELAAWAGFDGMEVLIDGRWDTRQADYLRGLQERYSLPVVSLHSPFVLRVDGWERDEVSRLKRTVALAEELGARTVVAHPPLRWHWAFIITTGGHHWRLPLPWWRNGREYGRWLQEELADFQAGTPVIIALENMPARHWGLWRLQRFRFGGPMGLERFPHLTLDTAHWGTWGVDILEVYERLKERVAHVHLSDYDGDKEHLLLGKGRLPLREFLRKLVADGFAGVIVVELDPRPLEAADEATVRRHLKAACEFCRQQGVGRRLFA